MSDEAISLLKQFCQGESGALAGVNLMKDLVMKRPTKQPNFLNSILEFCSHEETQVRETALDTVLSLYDRGELTNIIEEYSVMYLRFLLLARPPDMLFGEDRGRMEMVFEWTEEIIKVVLVTASFLIIETIVVYDCCRFVSTSSLPFYLGTRRC